MKITVCGSIAFYDEMLDAKKKLEVLGHEIDLPPLEIKDENGKMIPIKEYYERRKKETKETGWIWDRKEFAMKMHFKKIEWADSILIMNFDKNGIKDYIGPNTLMEMGLAFHLGKKIYLFNSIPDMIYKEEILGIKPVVINSDLKIIV